MNQLSVSKELRVLAVLVLVLSVAASAWGQTYKVINLTALSGVPVIYPVGLNNSGQVLGEGDFNAGLTFFLFSGGALIDLGIPANGGGFNDSGQIVGPAAGNGDPVLYSGGTAIDLGAPPGLNGSSVGINNLGQVLGSFYLLLNGYPQEHAFLYRNGKFIDLGLPPGATDVQPIGINNSGQVLGYCSGPNSGGACLYSRGTWTELGTLPGIPGMAYYSEAHAVNDLGQVVGASQCVCPSGPGAFLYSGGTMTALGALPGDTSSSAFGINNLGQVVGQSGEHAFLYRDGNMIDLNSLIDPSTLAQIAIPNSLNTALAINDLGQILAEDLGGNFYLLSPDYLPLTALNPFKTSAILRATPQTLDLYTVLNSPSVPKASVLAADGESALILVYQSQSSQPVTFATAASGSGLVPNIPVGSLGPYDANYLVKPNPAAGSVQSYQVDAPTLGPDADGNYEFAALLWAPNAMPAPNVALVDLAVTATQQGAVTVGKISIAVKPPPLLLIHGIWSSAAGARFAPGEHGFYDFVTSRYPHNLIRWVDYGVKVGGSPVLSSLTFSDSRTQNILLSNMTDLLADAAGQGMAARSVDVVAHSMGGLVTRYFLSTPGPLSPEFLPNPVHKFITIGTPHLGSNLAKALITNQGLSINTPSPIAQAWCGFTGSCTLGKVMGSLGKQVSTGAQSLEPGSPELNFLLPSNVFSAIVGSAPPVSETEGLLDVLINAFLPGQTVSSLLNNHANDTVVDVFSQNPGGAADTATITGLVHTAICDAPVLSAVCVDTGETASPAFWAQAYYWLTGGAGTVPAPSLSNFAPRPMTSTQPAPLPVLDLSGYTQVAASNVTFLPATGSALTINNAAAITASSSKTITEVLLLQAVTDPTDTALLSSTQSPFTIAFMPTRLGSANFGAIAVFSDNTYAATALSYTLQPDGTPYALNLVNAPVASMAAAESRVIEADAEFTSGPVNVTQAATYTARSGSTSVFSVSTGGTITATGNGVDLLDVTYGGVTATAQIPVGPCTYALNPTNQIVAYTGGTATIQVMTQSGCAWTADGGAAWLPLTQASGSGNGAIALTAAANSSGGAQGAMVTVGGLQALVTQPTTACVYSLSQTQISVLAVGGSGAITATTSCPVIASSDQSWLTANPLGATVPYTVAPNLGTSPRSATLTVGTVGVPVTQAGFVPPAILQIALGHFGNIWQGQIAAAYTVTVSDQAAGGPVSGMVTVTETVPSGLTLVSMSGTGWNCSSNVCTRSDTINSGAGYPAIAVNVNVAANAPSAVTNQVSVSGGGSVTASASDLTAISAFSTCDFQQNGSMNAADVQLIINEALGITAAVNDLNGDGVVNVLDVQIEINAALGLGCAAM